MILKIKIKITNFDDPEDQVQDHFKQVIFKIMIMILTITFQDQDDFYPKLLFEVLLRHIKILRKARIVARIIFLYKEMIRAAIRVLLSTHIHIYELHNFIKITLEIYSVLMSNNKGIIPYISKFN